jgi:hypothetical protein
MGHLVASHEARLPDADLRPVPSTTPSAPPTTASCQGASLAPPRESVLLRRRVGPRRGAWWADPRAGVRCWRSARRASPGSRPSGAGCAERPHVLNPEIGRDLVDPPLLFGVRCDRKSHVAAVHRSRRRLPSGTTSGTVWRTSRSGAGTTPLPPRTDPLLDARAALDAGAGRMRAPTRNTPSANVRQ